MISGSRFKVTMSGCTGEVFAARYLTQKDA